VGVKGGGEQASSGRKRGRAIATITLLPTVPGLSRRRSPSPVIIGRAWQTTSPATAARFPQPAVSPARGRAGQDEAVP